MFDKLYDLFFSPLGKEYCNFYLALAIIAFVGLVSNLVVLVLSLVNKGMKSLTSAALVSLLPSLMAYFTSRLMYSICLN